MLFKSFFKSKFSIAGIITIIIVLLATMLSQIFIFKGLELKTIDTLFTLRGPVTPKDSSIVIVAIDDESMAGLPHKYPFPMFYYARLVRNLTSAGARAIIFDIEFTDPNTDHPEYDLEFARAVTDAKNVVLAGKIVFEMGSYGTQNKSALKPIAPLLRSPAKWGFVNVIEDSDGFLRRYMLFQQVTNNLYYPLAIEAIRLLEEATVPDDQNLYSRTFQIGNHIIPKATPNTMYVNFRGPTGGTFSTYSLAHVLDDSTFQLPGEEDINSFEMHREWGTFKDKIVFVGATAEELQDNKFTPFFEYRGFKRKIPGVEFHANALSTVLKGDFITEASWIIVLLWTVILTALGSIVTILFRPFRALALIFAFVALHLTSVYLFFTYGRTIMTTTTPLIAVVLSFITSVVYQMVVEQREKKRIRQIFQHYVAPNVVDELLSSGELPSFGGERRELTILFSDIRKFTSFSESREPEIVVSRLSEYLTEMVDVIFKNNGTLDKFVGDEIMALFGAPYHYENHAMSACEAALEMVSRLRDIHKRWSKNTNDIFKIGIGINTGPVIVGNLGSSQLFDYTVIGDEVNLGARLEGANKLYQTTIILSESTYTLVKDRIKARELDYVRVVGRRKPIRIYELRGIDSIPQIEQDYIIDMFTEGLYLYRRRRWSDAIKAFRRVLRYFPDDGPARIYTIRCLDYIESPPSYEWEGVYEIEQK
ncbi:CHASE2 domain-containing protein [candidate division KSB1 bacterium]|nr:CHASE2 domain-containing protein [candidate division KSB1 bacterium]